jgi:hypothetical protein
MASWRLAVDIFHESSTTVRRISDARPVDGGFCNLSGAQLTREELSPRSAQQAS